MFRFFPFIALLLPAALASAQGSSVTFESPMEVAPSSFGFSNLRMELDADGHPIILHGKSGSSGGLYCTRWNPETGAFDDPVAVTDETGLFINDSEGPRMSVSGDRVVVGYQLSGQWTTGGRVVVSDDGGSTWGAPIAVSPNATEDHFMPVPAVDEDGQVWVALKWGTNPVKEGVLELDEETGAFLPPVDAGAGFPGDEVCECCASMPFSLGGQRYDVVRNNDGNLRDFHVSRTDAQGNWGETLDVDPTDWVINSCPASEAEVAVLGDGQVVTVFMSAGDGSSRTYWTTFDPSDWTVTGSDRIDPDVDFNENNPSVAASGAHSVAAWERNDGGYDIHVGVGSNSAAGVAGWGASANSVTEELSGHSRKPVIRMQGDVVHLVYQRSSEGVIHYLRGTISTSGLPHADPASAWRLDRAGAQWRIHGAPLPFSWRIIDLAGRVVDNGTSSDGVVPCPPTGMGLLQIETGQLRRSFKVAP